MDTDMPSMPSAAELGKEVMADCISDSETGFNVNRSLVSKVELLMSTLVEIEHELLSLATASTKNMLMRFAESVVKWYLTLVTVV